MTREEAINKLVNARYADEFQGDEELTTAHLMAIKALEQEPCDDAVSRDMALEKMADYVASGYADSAEDFEEYSRIICQLPPVNPQPRTGYWIVHEIESTLKWLECSNCHCETSYKIMYNYCPNCSAKMVEPQERIDKK